MDPKKGETCQEGLLLANRAQFFVVVGITALLVQIKSSHVLPHHNVHSALLCSWNSAIRFIPMIPEMILPTWPYVAFAACYTRFNGPPLFKMESRGIFSYSAYLLLLPIVLGQIGSGYTGLCDNLLISNASG